MTKLPDGTNLERLHNFSTQLLQEPRAAAGMQTTHIGEFTIVRVNDAMSVAGFDETIVVWCELAAKTLCTVRFDGSSEPATFLRWDNQRVDGEGRTVPKPQRDRIAGRILGIIAA